MEKVRNKMQEPTPMTEEPWTQDEIAAFAQTLTAFRDSLQGRQRAAFNAILNAAGRGGEVAGYEGGREPNEEEIVGYLGPFGAGLIVGALTTPAAAAVIANEGLSNPVTKGLNLTENWEKHKPKPQGGGGKPPA
jgi:hypothetical protein